MKLKHIMIMTVLYIIATLSLVILSNQNILENDTNRVLKTIDKIQLFLEKHPDNPLPDNFEHLPKNTVNSDTKKIKKGATYARSLDSQEITVTSPIFREGQFNGYLKVTENRTSTFFTDFAIIIFAILFYLAVAIQVLRSAQRAYVFRENTVAKIKNIERSPLTQSYLMNENDDKITTELNKLGEKIQKQALSHTEKKENLYEFIEFFQFPIFIYNNKGQIRRTNASFKNEFSDTENLDIFSPYADFLNFLVDKILHPDIQEKLFYFEKLGAYYQVRITPLPDLDSRFMVTMMDVSSYRRTVDAHNAFIANVSHELKTPLASIKGFAELLETDSISSSDTKNFASIINKESSRLMNLVQDTLLLTKQNHRIDKKKINLTALIQNILQSSGPQINEKSLHLESQIEEITFKTNEPMVHSIFENLIENAIKYTPANGQIFVSLHLEQNKVIFSVTDNGPGLSEIQKERIFDRFYRVDESRAEVSGTGLGLAIVEKNVQELHGTIDVVSILGKGTTFTVNL
ncbi:two-component sensor histidine kinase [Lactococcus lactis]|uniref:sensor histidine kinase n=1 Tax=Lactococcus lactis TaxID=1358 RepID=UPI00223C02B6|nr:HAMP domain-containing sensor histidine kinase [Lactococcus lactis]MCT1183357.1 two-component sensor histidine kinase [Lactococcus lactis]